MRISERNSTNVDDLRDIVRDHWSRPRNPFDEVYPGIFIGDARTAKDVMVLKMKRIAFIVNAAFGPDPVISVDTNDAFYSSRGYPCEFLGVPAVDLEVFKLHYFFKIGADFIEAALRNNGKVLVHCREGISRSATLVIAYLMMKKGMTAKEAVRLVRNKRQIYPNDGFLGQLCDLDLRLRGQRRL